MRTLISILSLTLLAPAALAERSPAPAAPAPTVQAPGERGVAVPPAPPAPIVKLAPIDPAQIPAPCKPLVAQAQAPSAPAAIAARISLASCIAEHAVAPIALCDCAESVVAIDAAIAPAIALLDDVIANAGPATQIIAEHTEGELYLGFANRLIATLPAAGPEATDSGRALRDLRKQALDAQLAPWREAAMTSFQHVVELARANAALTGNPTVASALRDSQRQLASDVTTG